MKRVMGIIVCLLCLSGCSEYANDELETPVEEVKDDELVETTQSNESKTDVVETPITEKEAIDISKQVTAEFSQLMRELGEKNGWDFEHPADYGTAKPELLKVATEEFADRVLKEYVETFYCNCDSVWLPQVDEQTVRLTTERDVNQFTIKGLVLPNHVYGGYELTMQFTREQNNEWKINGWNGESFIGKDMNFTKEEVQQAHPEYTVTEEIVLEEHNETVYKAESDFEIVGFSKKDGMIYYIE